MNKQVISNIGAQVLRTPQTGDIIPWSLIIILVVSIIAIIIALFLLRDK